MRLWILYSFLQWTFSFQRNASYPWVFEFLFRAVFDNATGKTEFKPELVEPTWRMDENGTTAEGTVQSPQNHVSKFRQLIETVVTTNPVAKVVEKYPHLALNSVLSKKHIFIHLAVVSGVYLGICITFHNPCFALIQRLNIVIHNFLSDAVFEVIVDIMILVIIIWITNATLF